MSDSILAPAPDAAAASPDAAAASPDAAAASPDAGIDVLNRALAAFEHLLVADDWLAARFAALAAVAADGSRTAAERLPRVHAILGEVAANKPQTLYQSVRQVLEARQALAGLIEQLALLERHVAGGRGVFERALVLAEDCADLDDVRHALRAIAHDAGQLGNAMQRGGRAVATTYLQFAGSAPPALRAGSRR